MRELARRMFGRLDGEGKVGAEELFARKDLIAAANRVQLGWLKLEAMYRVPERRTWALRETATVDEVAERVVRGGHGRRWREAAQWPLFRLLEGFGEAPGEYLERLGSSGRGAEVRRWRLAGRLARMYEEYQNYRPEMMRDWSEGRAQGTDAATAWEAGLWRALQREMKGDTLLNAYQDLPARVAEAAAREGWRRVEVFGTSMLSPVQMAIFRELGEHLEVTLSLFNPAKGDWFELPKKPLVAVGSGAEVRERPEDREWEKEEAMHPLLSRNGIGARDTVAVALDLTGGNVPDDEAWLEDGEGDLGRLQEEIGAGTAPEKAGGAEGDGSIRILLTHGKMREAEVVREEILRAFDERDGLAGLEPMDVQVQVAGLDEYAPYLEAVFGGGELPFAIERGTGAGEESARAFVQWMAAATGRFGATEILALLRAGPVRRKLGLDEEELRVAERVVARAGIRWGADAAHHGEACGNDFQECSWQHGLERMMLGYAMGEETEAGGVRACDLVEGEDAVTAGKVAAFMRRLADFRVAAKGKQTAAEWRKRLAQEFERNFDTARDGRGADRVRKALDHLETLAEASGCTGEEVAFEVVKEQLEAQLGEARVGANLERNAVQINELRVGSSTPRRVQVVMGLESGQFPGGETRAAYDLLRTGEGRKGRMGDRNPTRESRAAFLESLMSAGERLVLVRSAWTENLKDKAAAGPLKELEDWLARGGANGALVIKHKLHGYSPEYFRKKGDLVSYSASDRAAAEVLERQRRGGGAVEVNPSAKPEADWPASVDVEDIIRYFRNPAKAHWESLGVYWREGDAGTEDSEAFELDSLQEYNLEATGLEALQEAGAEASDVERTEAVKAAMEASCERMQKAGDAPLGRENERLVGDTLEDVIGMTAAWTRPREKETLLKALWTKCKPVNAETEVEVCGRKVRVTGTLSVGEDGVQALARCANPKARVRLEMWVKHLLGVASGKVQRTCVVQVKGDTKKRDDWPSAGSDSEAARKQLGKWVAAWAKWRGRVAPFSPEASTMFAARKDASKVLKAWQDDFEGGKDAYQMREFGRRGPMSREDFEKLADDLMGQIGQLAKPLGGNA